MEEEKPSVISKVARFIPTIEKSTYKQSLRTRLKWTGIVLVAYLVMSFIPVYGIVPSTYEQFRFLEIVLGSKFGSLMTLGISPIVTAGIILQLLVGSKIVNWDMTDPEGRKKFQTWNKVLSVVFCFASAAAYIFAGALPVAGGTSIAVLVILQLAAGGLIVILLDDIIAKWGVGSGVSLFIAAGVSTQIGIRLLSPFPSTCKSLQFFTCIPSSSNPPIGLVWQFFMSSLVGNTLLMLQSIIPILSTIAVFLVVAYIQDIEVNVPLSFSALRGFGRTWPLKLLYTSNIPVILAAALVANFQLMGRIGLTPQNGLNCGPLGCYDTQGNAVSGLVYYLSTPSNFLIDAVTRGITSVDVARAMIHILLFAVLATVFSIFWISTSGMDAKSIAEQIESIGMQIPGYRRDARTMEAVLNKYIPYLAFLGGLFVGLLAAVADITAAIGTGTGILLTVMIIYQYYEQLSMENLEEAPPIVRKVIGE
jgi:preprotein translocase subunit SecY